MSGQEAGGLIGILAGAYILGSVPFGLLFGRAGAGVDVRRIGSGNIGATNVLRAAGKLWAGLTLVADVLKGATPAYLALILWPETSLIAALAGLTAFLGHCFPVFLGFRGGKGVATALGVFLVLAPTALAAAVGVFVIVVYLTKMVSIGSLLGVAAVPPMLAWLDKPNGVLGVGIAIAVIIFWRHGTNIGRILRGEEKKLGERTL